MKITKFVHSCLLVETPDHVALFDPGMMSESAFTIENLARLDDIFITHKHADHLSTPFIKKLVTKFPDVRITSSPEVVTQLAAENITASTTPPSGAVLFDSPHESVEPLFPTPEEIGIHYLDVLSDPGDSHHFTEAKAILALPVTAPWGSAIAAVKLGLQLHPRYILPIHDWHWRDEVREMMYNDFEKIFKDVGIQFFKLETGKPVEIQM